MSSLTPDQFQEALIAGLVKDWATELPPNTAVMIGAWEPGMQVVDATGKVLAEVRPRPKPGSVVMLHFGAGKT